MIYQQLFTRTAIVIGALALAFTAIPQFHSQRRYSADDYENQTAFEKQSYLWTQIQASNTSSASWFNTFQLLELFFESVKPSGEWYSDFFPENRKKLLHAVGAIAKCELIFDHDYGYTGLFNATLGGSHHALCRGSAATKPSANEMSPAFSFKLLRDKVPSANFFAMWQLDGQKSLNFFENVFVNHLAERADLPLQNQLVRAKFLSVTKYPGLVGLSDMASYDESGKQIPNPKFPFALVFQPNPEIKQRFANYTDSDVPSYFPKSFRGTETLYKIYAVPDVSDTPQLLPIGSVKLTSPFTASKYADQTLFFRHHFMENDFAIRPDWYNAFADKTKKREEKEGALYYQPYLPPY